VCVWGWGGGAGPVAQSPKLPMGASLSLPGKEARSDHDSAAVLRSGWSDSQTPKSEEIQVGGVRGEPLSRGLGTRCGWNQRGDGRGVVAEARRGRSGGGAPRRSPVRSFFPHRVVLRRAAAPAWVQACGLAVGRVRNARHFEEDPVAYICRSRPHYPSSSQKRLVHP
jgi:hypothetical protein